MKKIIFSLNLLLIATALFAFEKVSTTDLLLSYLENDTELKNLTLSTQKAALSNKSTQIDNGFDVTLSTGTVTIKTSDDGTSVCVKPVIKASIPQADNLSISASSTILSDSLDNTDTFTDTALSFSVDLISASNLERKIALLKAERSYTEAKRKLDNQALTSEKEFYTSLKSLLNSTLSLLSKQSDLYEDTISFDKIKAQGYTSSSSSYRLAQMKVNNDQHEIDSERHQLNHDYRVFYKKCGYDIHPAETDDILDFIPDDIVAAEAVDLNSFSPDAYTETEAAVWTYKINSMTRQCKKFFTLSANGGYTFNNSSTKSDTIDAGISTTIGGSSLSAGVNLPVITDGSSINPAFTLSASVSPNSFRQYKLTKESNALDEQSEILAISTAKQNLGTKIIDERQSLEDIQWSKESNQSSYEMYAQLEKDMASWYKQGIVTQSEYLSAQKNAQNYKVQLIINDIDTIIYNDEVYLMFVKDDKVEKIDPSTLGEENPKNHESENSKNKEVQND